MAAADTGHRSHSSRPVVPGSENRRTKEDEEYHVSSLGEVQWILGAAVEHHKQSSVWCRVFRDVELISTSVD